MNRYKVATPLSVEQALAMLKGGRQMKILAGGTDLVVQMKENLLGDVDILDISKIEELKGIFREEGGIRIGTLTSLTEIGDSSDIADAAPCLAIAATSVGAVQIRNKATVGGNIMNASPAADTVPALVVLGAMAEIRNSEGRSEVPLEELFLSPGRTVLKDDEILTGLFIPDKPMRSAASFMKLGRRKAQAISVANLAIRVVADSDGDRFSDVRIALGSVAPTVVRIPEAENFLQDRNIGMENIEKAADLVAKAINPITDIRSSASYRRKASRALFIKAMLEALEQLDVEMA